MSEAILKLMTHEAVKRNVSITCNRTDGGGAQIQGRMSTLIFALHHGLEFFNTPISGAHFAEGSNWDDQWNSLVRFPVINDLRTGSIFISIYSPLALLQELFSIARETNKTSTVAKRVLVVEQMHWFTDFNPHLYVEYSELMRSFFTPTSHPIHSEAVVVHLRRGQDLTASVRYKRDDEVVLLVKGLAKKYPNKTIRVYTNEPLPELESTVGEGGVFDHLSNPFQAITHMKNAEVLVVAKSSMSYVAALLGQGEVFCPDFWHPRLPGWRDELELMAND